MGALPHGERPRLVVIGASAGGLQALQTLVAGLDPDGPAAFCVVVHLPPLAASGPPAILSRPGVLACETAVDGRALEAGLILVAPPDRHLVVDGDRVRLDQGPRENGFRPAVDVLFRSAADSRGSDVIGVVLSGARDDGAAGLAAIKARGGAVVVQDPEDASFPSMPMRALEHAAADVVATAAEIPQAIARLLQTPTEAGQSSSRPMSQADHELMTVCPACGGVMTETDSEVLQWSCHVGHVYSGATLDERQGVAVEDALWTGVRSLEDRAALLRRLADDAGRRGAGKSAQNFARRAARASRQADVLRSLVTRSSPSPPEGNGERTTVPSEEGPASD